MGKRIHPSIGGNIHKGKARASAIANKFTHSHFEAIGKAYLRQKGKDPESVIRSLTSKIGEKLPKPKIEP